MSVKYQFEFDHSSVKHEEICEKTHGSMPEKCHVKQRFHITVINNGF